MHPGASLKAIDCAFSSDKRQTVKDAAAEFTNCRFEGGGVHMTGSQGKVGGCRFTDAVLTVVGPDSPEVSGSTFTGGNDALHTLSIAKASPTVTDCTLTDGGGENTHAVHVRDAAAPRFTNLTVTGDRGWPVRVTGRSRAEFTRLRVDGGRAGGDSVYAWDDSEMTISDCRITNARANALAVAGGSLTVRDLIVEDTARIGLWGRRRV